LLLFLSCFKMIVNLKLTYKIHHPFFYQSNFPIRWSLLIETTFSFSPHFHRPHPLSSGTDFYP
jgi:hypothetical protein